MMHGRRWACWLGTGSLLAVAIACGSGGGSGSSEGAGAGFGSGSGGGTGGNLLTGGSGLDGGFEECAGLEEAATLAPVNMFITFDKSGSMDDDNKWQNATSALNAFFADPGAANLRVALRFFPHDEPTSNCGCDIDSCANMLVPLGALTAESAPADAQEAALEEAIDSTGPDGNTPMYAALGGALQAARDQQEAAPSEVAVVILVTDGEPNGCNEDPDDIAGLAADGLADGITTYSIGLAGSNESLMNLIAQQGGSNSAFLIGNGNTSADLLAALQAIQGNSVACQFVVPETSADGEPINPGLVNVLYSPNGGEGELVPQVGGADECGSSPGWYYDDPANPKAVILCPGFCDQVQASESAQIKLKFGCATQGPA